jgi:hypothetical protein
MPAVNTPSYPVVDPDPSTSKALSNFSGRDVANVFGFGAFGYLFGWATGKAFSLNC